MVAYMAQLVLASSLISILIIVFGVLLKLLVKWSLGICFFACMVKGVTWLVYGFPSTLLRQDPH